MSGFYSSLMLRSWLFAGGMLGVVATAHADTVQIAVAANFTAPAKQIAAAFERESGHQAQLSFGATGNFYAQIKNGAPFGVLLAADAKTPARLVKEGLGVADSLRSYAIGKLVLWSSKADWVDAQGELLRQGGFNKLAIADARTAPYGLAAEQAMSALGLLAKLRPLFVQGESIGQTFQFVATGSVDLGFVALSQISKDGRISKGSAWVVPQSLYEPIRQDVVLLKGDKHEAAASAFLTFLQSEQAQQIIRSYGYDLP